MKRLADLTGKLFSWALKKELKKEYVDEDVKRDAARMAVKFVLADAGMTLQHNDDITSDYSRQVIGKFLQAEVVDDDKLVYSIRPNKAIDYQVISVDI